MKEADIKKNVRENYGAIAAGGSSCCGDKKSSCCGGADVKNISKDVGYSEMEMAAVPEGANLGLGCGNPIALASLKAGETVLDLGSGAGFDCFLAANIVGKSGRVIGVDMTPEMLDRARENARKGGYSNVEFRLGEIENLPAADASVDVIISNCVINLALEKDRVFQEAFRVLKPGGRLMVSDIVLEKPLPEVVRQSVEAYVGCVAGAALKRDYLGAIKAAGFCDVKIVGEANFGIEGIENDPTLRSLAAQLKLSDVTVKDLIGSVKSIKVSGVKG